MTGIRSLERMGMEADLVIYRVRRGNPLQRLDGSGRAKFGWLNQRQASSAEIGPSGRAQLGSIHPRIKVCHLRERFEEYILELPADHPSIVLVIQL